MKDFTIRTVFKGLDKMSAPMSRIMNKMDRFERRIKKVSRRVDSMAKGFIRFGRSVAVGAGIATVAIANVTAAGMDFEQQMINAAVKFPGMIQKGTAEFAMLEEAARSAGRTVEFTARDAAGGLNFLAMAGFSAEQAVSALPKTLDLATVSGADLGTATDYATDTLGAFGLMTKDGTQLATNMERVNDVLAKTANSYNVTLDQLFSTIRNAAAPAKAAGIDIEQFSAMVGNLGNVGVKAFRAGTGIKNFALAVAAPTPAAEYLFKRKLKVDTLVQSGENKGDVRPIFDIIKDVSKAVEGLGKGNRLAVLRVLFGKESITTAEALMSLGSEALARSAKGLTDIEGYSTRAAKIMRNSFEGRWKALLSRVESVKISIFNLVKGPLSMVIEKMTKWLELNEKIIAGKVLDFLKGVWRNIDSIVFGLKLLVGAGGLLIAFSGGLKLVAGAIGLVNIMAGANPLGAFVLSIQAAVAGIVALFAYQDQITAFVAEWSDFGKVWDKVADAMRRTGFSWEEGITMDDAHVSGLTDNAVGPLGLGVAGQSVVTLKVPNTVQAKVDNDVSGGPKVQTQSYSED